MSVGSCNVVLVADKGLARKGFKMSEVNNSKPVELCPDCESEITESNTLIDDSYRPEDYGGCVDCYDPTPAGPEYSAGFEMNH